MHWAPNKSDNPLVRCCRTRLPVSYSLYIAALWWLQLPSWGREDISPFLPDSILEESYNPSDKSWKIGEDVCCTKFISIDIRLCVSHGNHIIFHLKVVEMIPQSKQLYFGSKTKNIKYCWPLGGIGMSELLIMMPYRVIMKFVINNIN